MTSHSPVINGYTQANFPCLMLGGASQKVTIGAASAQSATFSDSTTIIRIFTTTDCYIKVATNPTATTSDMFIAGGIIEYFGIEKGHKIAVIQDASGGTLHITEGA